jgi:hypothetical protein
MSVDAIADFDRVFTKPLRLFSPLPSIYPVFTSRLGQASGDFFLVELSFAAAVGISPTQGAKLWKST